MKFTVLPDPAGDYVTKTGRRVSVLPAEQGRDFASLGVFLLAMKLVEHGLAAAREAKLNALQRAFEAQCAAGAEVAGIRLACDDAGRAALDQFRSHEIARLALAADEAAREAIGAEPFALRDVVGQLHPMTVGQAVEAIIAAGETYKAWWSALAQKQEVVAVAQTIAAVSSVD